MTGLHSDQEHPYIVLGVITGHYGIKGWLKVRSYTRPSDEILQYSSWALLRADYAKTGAPNASRGGQTRPSDTAPRFDRLVDLADGKRRGKNLVVRFEGVNNREQAEDFIGATVMIHREQLAELDDGEFYWSDLTGLSVVNLQGVILGRVDHLIETGANDVLVVASDREADSQLKSSSGTGVAVQRLLPWIENVIRAVDLEKRVILVDWDETF